MRMMKAVLAVMKLYSRLSLITSMAKSRSQKRRESTKRRLSARKMQNLPLYRDDPHDDKHKNYIAMMAMMVQHFLCPLDIISTNATDMYHALQLFTSVFLYLHSYIIIVITTTISLCMLTCILLFAM